MISTGVFSPLTGFMGREDYESVVETMHLANGLAWSLPITLSASDEEANGVDEGDEVALTNGEGSVVATMTVTDRYSYDKGREASAVYRTEDGNHPGVAALYRQGNTLLGGEVTLLDEAPNPRPFPSTTTSRGSSARSSPRRAGGASWASRPATPSTARTSTSRRAPSKRWTASS